MSNMNSVIGMEHFLILAAIIFMIGMFGIFLNRKNIIVVLMSIELMLLAVSINFVTFSSYLHDLTGQIFVMFILAISAAEMAVGLAILIVLFRNKGSIATEDISDLKG